LGIDVDSSVGRDFRFVYRGHPVHEED